MKAPSGASAGKSFLGHAKVIGSLTLLSRLAGLGREMVAGHYLGTGLIASAFTVAFTVPNLFRKLFGEGALSAAFIPLYAQAVKAENDPGNSPSDNSLKSPQSSSDFATAGVNLLSLILLGITFIGECILGALIFFGGNLFPDLILTFKLTAIMLPYVLLICGGAFLSGILQVHKRFAAPAAAPIILNVVHILVLAGGAWMLGLSAFTPAGEVEQKQLHLVYALALAVLVAGVLQVGVLWPGLRAVGFRFRVIPHFWTPLVRRMIKLTVPVALGAGVLQLSVVLDKGIALGLMQRIDHAGNLVTHFNVFDYDIRFPMEMGAPRRLDMAQFLYQFPLGIFAIALATAIFPGLSADALDKNRDQFKSTLRTGIAATLWEGLPASVGLILVCQPAVRLLFQHGQLDDHSATLIAQSTAWYAGAIWAFALLQIVNRAYYATHDTVTPLVMSVVNIAINLIIEIPLLWFMGESAMAVGTLVSFIVQALVMLWMLDRRVEGLGLHLIAGQIGKVLIATALMGAACVAVQRIPGYPITETRTAWAMQLLILVCTGVVTYFLACAAMGVAMLGQSRQR